MTLMSGIHLASEFPIMKNNTLPYCLTICESGLPITHTQIILYDLPHDTNNYTSYWCDQVILEVHKKFMSVFSIIAHNSLCHCYQYFSDYSSFKMCQNLFSLEISSQFWNYKREISHKPFFSEFISLCSPNLAQFLKL